MDPPAVSLPKSWRERGVPVPLEVARPLVGLGINHPIHSRENRFQKRGSSLWA